MADMKKLTTISQLLICTYIIHAKVRIAYCDLFCIVFFEITWIFHFATNTVNTLTLETK